MWEEGGRTLSWVCSLERQSPAWREGPWKGLDVTYSIGDIPAKHHLGLLLSLLGPVQHEAKSSVDHLTPTRGKEVSRPAPAWSRKTCTHIWGTLWKRWLKETVWLAPAAWSPCSLPSLGTQEPLLCTAYLHLHALFPAPPPTFRTLGCVTSHGRPPSLRLCMHPIQARFLGALVMPNSTVILPGFSLCSFFPLPLLSACFRCILGVLIT